MALTADQTNKVFEILDIPPNTTVFELWGSLGEQSAVQNFAFRTASEAVTALIALLDTDQETIVSGLILEWDEVRTSEIELKEAEGAKGVVTSGAGKRRLIRDRLQLYVPLYREGEMDQRHGWGNYAQSSNQIVRG